ncbi:MAG: hypothetical protein GXP55_04095 [Deltaproteobacteria bacterium]|nr:hypothetical protein [Deltaproteobacteria bacterium]
MTRADLWYVSLSDGNRDALDSLPALGDAVPYMRAAFARARERGVDLRSLHVPHCLLGDDADRAFEPARERVRVVTPDSSFDLSESRLTPNTHVPACEACARRQARAALSKCGHPPLDPARVSARPAKSSKSWSCVTARRARTERCD